MKTVNETSAIALLCLGLAGCAHGGAPAPEAGGDLTVSTDAERGGTQPGGDVTFTGEVSVSMLFTPQGARTFSGAWVTFQPGARTAWHRHPAGQTLVVTEGTGWVQAEGGERRELKPGDVVWTPPGVRHWHGGTASTPMTHMALQGSVADGVVEWGEKVSDAEYDPE